MKQLQRGLKGFAVGLRTPALATGKLAHQSSLSWGVGGSILILELPLWGIFFFLIFSGLVPSATTSQ